jgi:hypothetical protein
LSRYRRKRPSIDIEFEDSRDHHDRALPVSILVAHIAERRIAAYEKAPARPALILNDPVSTAVLAHHQDGRFQARGRLDLFALYHDLFFLRDESRARDHARPESALDRV